MRERFELTWVTTTLASPAIGDAKAGAAENAQDFYDCAPEPAAMSDEARAYNAKLFEGMFPAKAEKPEKA